MATQPMIEMQRRLKGGREYLAALQRLGFRPDALLWAGVGDAASEGAMELLMVTTWADNIGPKAIYDLLFEAYDLSATPKEINPFTVSLFSPNTQVAMDLAGGMKAIKEEVHKKRSGKDFRPMLVLGMMDYYTIPEWIISYRATRTTAFEDARRFAAFQSNIAKLAA